MQALSFSLIKSAIQNGDIDFIQAVPIQKLENYLAANNDVLGLAIAAKKNKVELLKHLLPLVQKKSAGFKTEIAAAYAAAEALSDREIKRQLLMQLDAQADLTTGLFRAIRENQPELVLKYLRAGAQYHHPEYGYALHYAICEQPALVGLLLGNGVNDLRFEKADINRHTAISLCAERSQWDNIWLLANQQVSGRGDPLQYGRALMYAVKYKKYAHVAHLLAQGASFHWNWTGNGNCHVHDAIVNRDLLALELLINAGADLNQRQLTTAQNPSPKTGVELLAESTDEEFKQAVYLLAMQPRKKRRVRPEEFSSRERVLQLASWPRIFTAAEYYALWWIERKFLKKGIDVKDILGIVAGFFKSFSEEQKASETAGYMDIQKASTQALRSLFFAKQEPRVIAAKIAPKINPDIAPDGFKQCLEFYKLELTHYRNLRELEAEPYRKHWSPLWLRKIFGAQDRQGKLAGAEALLTFLQDLDESKLTQHQAAINQGRLGKIKRRIMLTRQNY